MPCSPPSALERLAAGLIHGLRLELFLTPKPGLVDLYDRGSHPDLSLPRMLASIDLVGTYLRELVGLLEAGADLPRLRAAGLRAEAGMLTRLGTNTHKGAIFLTGLLLTARSRLDSDDPADLSHALADCAAEFFSQAPQHASHGTAVRQRFGLAGIQGESLHGLPSLFQVALPAYLEILDAGGDHHLAAFFMLARLMQSVEDSTAVHRCGPAGLARLRHDGRRLEELVMEGGDPVPLLLELNEGYRRMNLTMGGVADILGLAFGLLHAQGILPVSRPSAVVQASL